MESQKSSLAKYDTKYNHWILDNAREEDSYLVFEFHCPTTGRDDEIVVSPLAGEFNLGEYCKCGAEHITSSAEIKRLVDARCEKCDGSRIECHHVGNDVAYHCKDCETIHEESPKRLEADLHTQPQPWDKQYTKPYIIIATWDVGRWYFAHNPSYLPTYLRPLCNHRPEWQRKEATKTFPTKADYRYQEIEACFQRELKKLGLTQDELL